MPQANAPCLLDARQMEAHLQRLCREIVAVFGDDETVALLGIRTRGLHLAERLKTMLLEFPNVPLADVPDGGEEDSVVVRLVGEPRAFDFEVNDYAAI